MSQEPASSLSTDIVPQRIARRRVRLPVLRAEGGDHTTIYYFLQSVFQGPARAEYNASLEDPFYEPPAGFHHAEPGTILRSRDVELGFLGLIPQRVRATQLLYRTTDRHGHPEATVTTVLVPAGHSHRQTRHVVSYQCAIDAVTSRCMRRTSSAIRSARRIDPRAGIRRRRITVS